MPTGWRLGQINTGVTPPAQRGGQRPGSGCPGTDPRGTELSGNKPARGPAQTARKAYAIVGSASPVFSLLPSQTKGGRDSPYGLV